MTKSANFFGRRTPGSWFTCKQHEDVLDSIFGTDEESFAKVRQLARPLGLINGGFDILTSGHLRLVSEARYRSATLVALLDSDTKLRQRKGPLRPAVPWPQRAASLFYCGVDVVFEVSSDEEFITIVGVLDPDFRVLGVQYKDHSSRFPGIPTIYVRDNGLHTTDIINRILDNAKKAKNTSKRS